MPPGLPVENVLDQDLMKVGAKRGGSEAVFGGSACKWVETRWKRGENGKKQTWSSEQRRAMERSVENTRLNANRS